MSSPSNVTHSAPWTSSPGLYSIHNIDHHVVLDQEDSAVNKIHCCAGEPSFNITNPNQLWHLVMSRDQTWRLINERTGNYLAAPDAHCSVMPQTGHMDWTAAHWWIEALEYEDSWAVVFLSVAHPGSCLELVGGHILKIGPRKKGKDGQIWFLKKQS